MSTNSEAIPQTRFCACQEVASASCVLVVFGATGDLFARKLLPALFQMHTAALLHTTSRIVGCGRTAHTDDSFRKLADQALPSSVDRAVRDAFLSRLGYVQIDEGNASSFAHLSRRLDDLDRLVPAVPFSRLYYLAVPPAAMQPLVARLSEAGLLAESEAGNVYRHILIEKPFGSDSRSAVALDAFLKQHVKEDQLFRIDHYLGKDTVQNILIMRFANILFDPVWNADCIDHVQITVAETLGVEHRAGYYDKSGLLRDMFQNHLLELLALVAMEAPDSFEADAIQRAKLGLIRSIQPFPPDALGTCMVRGQYKGYREEAGVAPDSNTETFAAAKIAIDSPRWRGVPFYLRSGKRLATRVSTVTVAFKPSPFTLFGGNEGDRLTLRIQPDEGVCLHLQAKRPGPKLCLGEMTLAFRYASLGDTSGQLDAYARLLLDAMLHDHTLFVRNDTISASWRLFTPVLESWQQHPEICPLHGYEAGSDGPAAAVEMLARDGRVWEPLD